MTEITEVKTGAAPTTDLICPLMSGQIVPRQVQPGGVVAPGQAILAPSVVTCARENCRWWDESSDECILLSIGEALGDVSNCLVSLRNVLEPATESPLVRIADNLEEMRKTLDDSECLSPRPRPPRPSRGREQDKPPF